MARKLKHPRIKCRVCGTNDYWVWNDEDDFWTCDEDGCELYPPSHSPDRRWEQSHGSFGEEQ